MIDHAFQSLDTRDGRNPGLYAVDGCYVQAPTTASTQATGAGASDYNANASLGSVVLDGVAGYIKAAADVNLDAAAGAVLTNGEARYYALVAWLDRLANVVRFGVVKGTIAAVASVARVSTAQVEAKIGTTNPYVVLGQTLVHRSGDTAITQTYENHDRLSGLWTGRTVPSAATTISVLV